MALENSLTYSIDQNGKRLVITDSTGEYNTINNTTGWGVGDPPTSGSPQPYLKSILYAVLEITNPGGTLTTIDIITDLGITFSASTVLNDLIYEIDNADIGLSSSAMITDGEYKIVYKLSDNATYGLGNSVEITKYVGVYTEVENAVMCLIKEIYSEYTYNSCDNSYIQNLSGIWALFVQMQYAAWCGDMTAFTNILSTLNDLDEIQNTSCT